MDVLGDPINLEHIQAHTKRTNPKATGKLLSILGRKRKFVDQINTELGQALFHKITARLEELFEKVADDTAEPEEKMEFKVTRGLLSIWATEMGEYVKAKNKLQGKE
jgi:hypothetical protein